MNLIPKIFGARPLSVAPAHTVYLQQGQPMPLAAALQSVAASRDVALLAQFIDHYSGYVREAAIARAVELGDSALLEPIAARINDWVPEVRRAATNALSTLLATVPPECFVALLPALRRLTSATRDDHGPWLHTFEQRLVQAGGVATIVDAMHAPDFRLRRAACVVAFAHRLLPAAELVTYGLTSGDIVVARRAVAMLDDVPAGDRMRCIDLAAGCPFGPVRRAALGHMIDAGIDDGTEPFLWRATLDSQGSVRATAARLLAELGRQVADRCIALLDTGTLPGTRVRAALSLLAELRAPAATATIERFSTDARSPVRAHALMLLARLSPATRDEVAARALLDPARRIRKTAVRLCEQGAFVPLAQIEQVLDRYGDRHAARSICARDQWDSLVCIVLIAARNEPSDDPDDALTRDLQAWLRNPVAMWTRPGAAQRAILGTPDAARLLATVARDHREALRSRLLEHGIEI
ncbi:hypothetical protein GQ57_19600 [Burkholderia sp. MSh2]|uniref:HEAT repeat domain-containing protein n=1 Tax=Burkholderia paludis TaxID=1506587 RepID=A0A6P2KGJ9_9BURK|nr:MULTISPECIES: hypothetical protein [Burkholderia]KEZ04146.1 hypothetical protein GQ57_19600 [Burkholderia sp. MSh2]CAB3759544.1 hypothetical protein LMG30113_03492 [Burkholderia paludis]VWB55647.1 hypothetical protein BPA30113_02434 [Burkholderia paludis]